MGGRGGRTGWGVSESPCFAGETLEGPPAEVVAPRGR